ncbi:hypothetical protein MRB53_027656 [Persea americana]|uniref:Uncharacterized protein n=1 Tax=Persea americana TaxID=3435 RepID=A0ACC2LLG9_PERAE|nr:hypothetical protein MRB53_027656 [Persea americana]
MAPPRRKKWTEEEERTLIEKYSQMSSDGTLAKMKTREKKFRPIAAHVNSLHHSRDPSAFPWLWSWKDASTKVQNMRHQYLLVKQKIRKQPPETSPCAGEDFYDWADGVSHWPNFLRYKDVFGDVPEAPSAARRNNRDHPDGFGFDPDENGVLSLGLGFEYDEEGDEIQNSDGGVDGDENCGAPGKEDGEEGFDCEGAVVVAEKGRKRLKGADRRAMGWFFDRFAELRAREGRLEAERERERRRRERARAGEEEERGRAREKARRERLREWEAMEKEFAEREQRRREEELVKEREWEERMDRRRLEWKKRMDDMMVQHRATMDQLQSRILHEQQGIINQLLGLVSQWTGHSAGISDHNGAAGNPYLSQMIPNLHHVNGIDNRVGTDNHDDQFIVDE